MRLRQDGGHKQAERKRLSYAFFSLAIPAVIYQLIGFQPWCKISAPYSSQTISGWSGVNQDQLKTWAQILPTTSPDRTTYNTSINSDYALELHDGDSLVHSNFIVPDWGVLRFDLHDPTLGSGSLKVTLQATDGSMAEISTQIDLTTAAIGTADEYLNDTRRVGYGTTGFETFTLDIPDNLKGKVATLSFTLDSDEVYLDNVFFKSQHLLFGNPTESRNTGTPIPDSYYNNYLLEKPQYAVSYSGDSYIPNWSAWEVNKSWTGSDRPDEFFRDPSLNSLGFVSAKESDYARPLSNIIPGPNQANGQPYKLAPGHLSPNADQG